MSKYSAARDLDLNVTKRWYVVANRTDAVIYTDTSAQEFHFVARLANPKGKLTESQLDSDRPGKGFSSSSGGMFHHALDRRSAKHEQAAKQFAQRIGKTLDAAKREGRFTELILVAEPHFLGLLRAAAPAAVRSSITHEVGREYAQGSDSRLRSQIMAAIESGKGGSK